MQLLIGSLKTLTLEMAGQVAKSTMQWVVMCIQWGMGSDFPILVHMY